MPDGSGGEAGARRSRPVTPSYAGAAARLLKNSELFVGKAAPPFSRDLGEYLIQPGIKLFLGQYRDGGPFRAGADA